MNPITFYPGHVRPEGSPILIGSSDIPIIIKTARTSLKKSQRELWLEKRGEVAGFQGNDSTEMGNELEPITLGRFIKKEVDAATAYKFKVDMILHEEYRAPGYSPPTDFWPYTEALHPDFPWMVAHADAIHITEDYGIEAKTGGYWARVKREGYDGFDVDKKSEAEDPDKIPIEVMLQVQWQMLCYGLSLWYVVLLVDNKIYTYKIPAFRKWFPIMIEKASRFYNCCITGEMPPPEKKEDVFAINDSLLDKAVYVIGERAVIGEAMSAEKKKLRARIKRDKARIEDIDDGAVLLMGDNKQLFNGETAKKLFSQSVWEQYDPISPTALTDEDRKKYEDLGIVHKGERRRVN